MQPIAATDRRPRENYPSGIFVPLAIDLAGVWPGRLANGGMSGPSKSEFFSIVLSEYPGDLVQFGLPLGCHVIVNRRRLITGVWVRRRC